MNEKSYDIYWEGNEHSKAPCGQRITYVKTGRVWAYFYNKPTNPEHKWKFKKKVSWWQDRQRRGRINEYVR
tara:strand:+ start:2261 stop:2473 length:213 start_codon:yes stop_codon:yes gene_type:complete